MGKDKDRAELEDAIRLVIGPEIFAVMPGGLTTKLKEAVHQIFVRELENQDKAMKKAAKIIRKNILFLEKKGYFEWSVQ